MTAINDLCEEICGCGDLKIIKTYMENASNAWII